MDRIGYEEERKVRYFQIDSNSCMTPAALLSSLQEMAITHSDTLGYTIDYMLEHQWFWSVLNWHLKLYRMPKYGEKIILQTWSDKFARIQANRSFFVFDVEGNKLMDGISRWAFMDLEKRKIPDAQRTQRRADLHQRYRGDPTGYRHQRSRQQCKISGMGHG